MIVGAALLLCAFLKVPTLYYPHDETDERIYWQLGENLATKGQYTLQGTELLASLSPGIYDQPLFHHPPLFPALLVPFVLLAAKHAAVTVSWLGHLLAVLAVALVGRRALRNRPDGGRVSSPGFWLPVLALSADPLLQFVSRKLWIDSILAGLMALSLAILLIADGSRRRGLLLAFSGILLGLAGLAKLSALMVVPVYVLAIFRDDPTWRARVRSLMALSVPVGVLVVPWCVVFYLRCGVFLPPWVKPDAWLIEHSDFIKAMVERPWYYYALKFPLLAPLALVCLWQIVRDRAGVKNRTVGLGAVWFLVILSAVTTMGVAGYGFQMRHIAPAAAAVYVVALGLLLERDRPVLLVASGFAMLVGTVTGALYLLVPGIDEILSLAEIARIVTF